MVFVTGEPGIGKTTLIDAFRQRLEAGGWRLAPSSQASSLKPLASSVSFAHGQCIEHYGAGEAYLPMLDAFEQLCRAPGGERLVELLNQHAPTWLVQMPALLTATDLEAVQRRVVGATRERMLREMTGAIEAFTTDCTLVLVLEDLHWSDYSTLDLLSFMARRQGPARLLVLGTYRPGDVLRQEHPLQAVKQELHLHGQCGEIRLESLTTEEVGAYLASQFPDSTVPATLGAVVHHRTEGNPLFVVNVVKDFVTRGVIVQRDGQWDLVGEVGKIELPSGLRQFVEQQVARSTLEERAVLEAASVVGMDFSVAAVASALRKEIPEVEECCEAFARRSQFLGAHGATTWPDGTVTARYRFLHAVYQEVLYEQVSAGRRIGIHRQVGARVEAAYGNRATEIATELAVHFEQGQDLPRAVHYLQRAGESATRRSAHQEAIHHFTKGLELLDVLPDTPESAQQELTLQIALGGPLMAIKGFSAPEVSKVCARARELCRQVGDTPQLFLVLGELGGVHLIRGELQTAQEIAEQLLRLAHSLQRPARLQAAHHFLGQVWYALGEFTRARADLEQAITLYEPRRRRVPVLYDSGVASLSIAAFTLWALGYPVQARTRIEEALTLAQDHPFSLSYALFCVASLHQSRQEGLATYEQAEAIIALAREQGFTLREAEGAVLRGWALAERGQGEEGIAQLRQGLATTRAMGAELHTPYFLGLLAEAYATIGKSEEGLTVLAEAFAVEDKTGERHYEAELYRLKGELTLQQESQNAKVKM